MDTQIPSMTGEDPKGMVRGIPNSNAQVLLVSSVAAMVQDDTTAEATRPVLMLRWAVMNISDPWTSF